MSKDPSFLLYTGDFIVGTMFMTNEDVGIYIRLLCAQHQHGGMIPKETFNTTVNNHEKVRAKFTETKDGFYNIRLMEEMVKRQKKSTNLSANAFKRWAKEKQKQYKSNANADADVMPTEDEDENRDINKDEAINEIVKEIIDDLNFVLGTKYKPTTKKTISLIKARLEEGFTVEDFKNVHKKMYDCWFGDNKMVKFLRPLTLYNGEKFEGYLNQKEGQTILRESGLAAYKIGGKWLESEKEKELEVKDVR